MALNNAVIGTFLNRIKQQVEGKNYRSGNSYITEANRLLAATGALQKIRESKNPTETEAAFAKRVASSALMLKGEIGKAKTRSSAALSQGIIDIDNRITERLGMFEDRHAAEIRTAFRNLSREDRLHTVDNLIKVSAQ